MTLEVSDINAPATRPAPPAGEWWRMEPLSILELADPLHVAERGVEGFDPQRIVARMREMNATAAHVFPLGCHLDGDVLLFRHESPGDPPAKFDYLQGWLEHSVSAGLRTVVYFNVHSVKAAHARRHPDWQAKRFDGSPKEDVYHIESTFCVNSPWRQWVFARLRELCDYPIDGIFFDGPVFFDDCCYCAHCKAKFAARHDFAMPPMDDVQHAKYRELVDFRAESVCDFVRESRGLIRSIRPGLLLYVNANPLQPSRLTARDNRRLAECTDILAAEGGFLGGNLMNDAPIWKVGMNAKLLETQASHAGVPHLVFDSVIHSPWTYYTLPAAEARLLWASSVAHGAGTWMSAYKDSIQSPAVSAIGELYAFGRRQQRRLAGTQSLATVAVVVSADTLNYYAGADVSQTDFTAAHSDERPGNVTRELYGWYHALWTSHVPFDVIDEGTVESAKLSRYRVIVLPNVACVSEAFAARLREFVAGGGTVLASFQTGCFDERGRRRGTGVIDDVFGVRRDGAGAVEGPRRWDYLLDGDRRLPSPEHALRVGVVDGAKVLMSFSRPQPDRYAGLPRDSGDPAVIAHRFGRGRALYCACDLGAALWKWRLPEHLALVQEAIHRHAGSPVRLLGAAPCVDVSMRRTREGAAVVHLVNYNGGMTRPIQRVLPLRDLVLEARAPLRAARALFHPVELEVTRAGDGLTSTVHVGNLDEYEMIQLEVEQGFEW